VEVVVDAGKLSRPGVRASMTADISLYNRFAKSI
jgi:predicted unusual protein kinase regulating ubiquinone biosynthesis (AarF/ABC1/UbiB family)